MEAMARKDLGEGFGKRSGNYSGRIGKQEKFRAYNLIFSHILGGSDHKRPKNDGPVRNS